MAASCGGHNSGLRHYVINVTVKDQTAPRGARAAPLSDRAPEMAEPAEIGLPQRSARRLELRQADFDLALGSRGTTEHGPKCERARLH